MISDKQCEIAKIVTESRISVRTIKEQYALVSPTEKFLLSNSIDQILRKHNVTFEEGWNSIRYKIEEVALDYIVDPATAYCMYTEWKRSR